MFDVFYLAKKPGLFGHERAADSIEHARNLSRTRYFWIVTYLADYTDWDWLWEPPPWQANQRHAWASQWQRDSGTYLVPKSGYTDTNYHDDAQITMTADLDLWQNIDSVTQFDFSWHPDYTDPPFNYEFGTQWQKTGGPRYPVPGSSQTKYVSQSGSRILAKAAAIYLIDHMDGTANEFCQPVSRRIRYFDNYKDTLTRLSASIPLDQEFVWICSTICDYGHFDFSWHPEAWQNHMLHVFASGDQKFGDTFFMHVPTFRNRIQEFELLEWYDLNFVPNISIPRRPMPEIRHRQDSHIDLIKTSRWAGPLALFSVNNLPQSATPTVPLWREKTKTVIPLDFGGESVIVPAVAVPYVQKQIYDYPWIDRDHRNQSISSAQDIVFISYDEPQADENWQRLHDRFPRAHRVHGVAGMDRALVAAAKVSRTPWYFAVFAKTELADQFDFTFAPDYLQQPKHYIFDCLNTVNGLQYGHMGVVLYNVNYVLQQRAYQDLDLDYTLSFPHEVVPELSCYGRFDSTAYHTWRTAFRECAKLSLYNHREPSVDTEYRLSVWLTKASGEFADWCLQGARDGVEFFQECRGELDQIKRSFDWQWLRNRFRQRHGDID